MPNKISSQRYSMSAFSKWTPAELEAHQAKVAAGKLRKQGFTCSAGDLPRPNDGLEAIRTDAGRRSDSSPLLDGRSVETIPLKVIVITGKIMGGKNNICITRTGHRFPNAKWAKWRDQAVQQVKDCLPTGFKTLTTAVSVRLFYYAGDMRRRDCPAILDAIWHVLEKAGVVKDDTLLWPIESERLYDKENPRTIIEIV